MTKSKYEGKWHLDSDLDMTEVAKPLAMQVGGGPLWSLAVESMAVQMIQKYNLWWADTKHGLIFYDENGDLFSVTHPSIDPRTINYQMLWDLGIRSWSWGLP